MADWQPYIVAKLMVKFFLKKIGQYLKLRYFCPMTIHKHKCFDVLVRS
jgi:hypothetical protein